MRYTGAPERTVIAYENVSGNPEDVSAATPLPTTGGGGGGGGGSLSDTVFVDSTGQLFVYRDTGTGTPEAYAIPSWTLYVPVNPISVPAVNTTAITDALDDSGLVSPDNDLSNPAYPVGSAVRVTMRDYVSLDPASPTVISGVGPDGAYRQARVGTDGGLQLTDAKVFTGLAQNVNGSPTGWIDTAGYQSIVVTFSTTVSATVVFQTTNDISVPTAAGNLGGWPASGAAAPAVTLANPTAGATWVFPVTARFFRVFISSYSSGTLVTTTVLRSAPAPFLGLTPSVTATATVSGSIAAGDTATANPVPVSGVDYGGITRRFLTDGVGNQQAVGNLPQGYQLNTFNVTYGRSTNTLASQTAANSIAIPVTMGGLDGQRASRAILTDTFGAIAVGSAPSNQANQSIQDLLTQILGTLRALAHYSYEDSDRPKTVSDEPDVLIAEYTHQANQFRNMTN